MMAQGDQGTTTGTHARWNRHSINHSLFQDADGGILGEPRTFRRAFFKGEWLLLTLERFYTRISTFVSKANIPGL
jgi:hypothetical protein